MSKLLFSFIIFLFFLLEVKAGTIDPNKNDDIYVEYGKKFECVFKIHGKYNDGTSFTASSVVINSHWILTAAHVVKNAKTVAVSSDGNETFELEKIILHPDFDELLFEGNDIALGYSSKPIHIKYYPELYEANDEIGKICAMAGYGLTGNFNTGCNSFDGKRRAGTNIIDSVEHELLICSPSFEAENNKTVMEFLICQGDSGGGLFIDKKIAGIHSLVFAKDKDPNSNYTDQSGHTKISKHKAWIRKYIR